MSSLRKMNRALAKPWITGCIVVACLILIATVDRGGNKGLSRREAEYLSSEQKLYVKPADLVDLNKVLSGKDTNPMQGQHTLNETNSNGMIANIDAEGKSKNEKVTILTASQLNTHDILGLPQLHFLPNYTTPCFYIKDASSPKSPKGSAYQLRCIPYFMYGGFPKCASTDMYNRLTHHHHVATFTGSKEPLWWYNLGRLGKRHGMFSKYMSKAMKASVTIRNVVSPESCVDNKGMNASCHHPVVLGDFSTREIMNEYQPYKKGHNAWDLILHLNPAMKFVVLMRNPVERLYSDFIYFAEVYKGNQFDVTPEYFHTAVQRQVEWWQQCVNEYDTKICLFGQKVGTMSKLRVYFGDCWAGPEVCSAFRIGFYFYFITAWLEDIPRDQFLFIRADSYFENEQRTVEQEILPFLGLEPYKEKDLNDKKLNQKAQPLGKSGKEQLAKEGKLGDMLPETRTLLNDLYRDSNTKLAEFLGDKDIWKDYDETQ